MSPTRSAQIGRSPHPVGGGPLGFRHQSAQPSGRCHGGARHQLCLRRDLAVRQQKAGDTTFWSLETSGETEIAEPYDYAPVTALLPNHGGFAAFYSSAGDSHAIEIGFLNADDRTSTQYGVFSFRLANVIQNRESMTVRSLAESLKTLPKRNEAAARQRYRVEASDRELVMFSDGSRQLPLTDPIVIQA